MFSPKLSLIPVNLKSKKLRKHLTLIIGIAILYLLALLVVIGLSMLGTTYPDIWKQLTNTFNGMSFEFSLSRAAMPLSRSAIYALISIILFVLIWVEAVRWQFSLLILEGTSILSLMYLVCSIFYLFSDNIGIHLLMLLLSAGVYMISFWQYSNIPFYWSKRSSGHLLYGDIILELMIGFLFLLLVAQTLLIALGINIP